MIYHATLSHVIPFYCASFVRCILYNAICVPVGHTGMAHRDTEILEIWVQIFAWYPPYSRIGALWIYRVPESRLNAGTPVRT